VFRLGGSAQSGRWKDKRSCKGEKGVTRSATRTIAEPKGSENRTGLICLRWTEEIARGSLSSGLKKIPNRRESGRGSAFGYSEAPNRALNEEHGTAGSQGDWSTTLEVVKLIKGLVRTHNGERKIMFASGASQKGWDWEKASHWVSLLI